MEGEEDLRKGDSGMMVSSEFVSPPNGKPPPPHLPALTPQAPGTVLGCASFRAQVD